VAHELARFDVYFKGVVEILGPKLVAHIRFQKFLRNLKAHVTCSPIYWLHKGKGWELSLVPHEKFREM
jgi:hypothetical protein